MSTIGIRIGLILLFMGAPDLCRRARRPALTYPAFILLGRALGPVAADGTDGADPFRPAPEPRTSALSCPPPTDLTAGS